MPARKPVTYVVDTDGCHVCTSHRPNESGAILAWAGPKRTTLQRMTYEKRHGLLLPGTMVRAKCGKVACINPEHLIAVTRAPREDVETRRRKQAIGTRRHYERNAATIKARSAARNQRITEENRQRLIDYLRAHPCVDCGEGDPLVLEFDHVRGEKEADVSRMLVRRYSWKRILGEIDKCEVRCANCHRRKTIKQFGWYRLGDVV